MSLSRWLGVDDGRLTLQRGKLPSEVDVDTVGDWSARGLAALMAHLFQATDRWGEVSPGARQQLGAELKRGRAGALRWEASIEALLESLNAAGIEPALLKGADLAFHAYPEPGLRAMTDIDILVPEEQLVPSQRVLEEMGFRANTGSYSIEWYLQCRKLLPPMVHEEQGIHVDVHATVLPPYSPFEPGWGSYAFRPSRWPGASRLSAETMLWHLAVHGTVIHLGNRDAMQRLGVDLMALLAADGLPGAPLLCLGSGSRSLFAIQRALALVEGDPGVEGFASLRQQVTEAARSARSSELRARVEHAFRHAVPFLGAGVKRPPDAWRQLFKRPWRLLRSLVGGS